MILKCSSSRLCREQTLPIRAGIEPSNIVLQHYVLLSRNLFYTGLTRAKQLAILVGPTKVIGLSIKRVTDRQRYTALADRLRSFSNASAE